MYLLPYGWSDIYCSFVLWQFNSQLLCVRRILVASLTGSLNDTVQGQQLCYYFFIIHLLRVLCKAAYFQISSQLCATISPIISLVKHVEILRTVWPWLNFYCSTILAWKLRNYIFDDELYVHASISLKNELWIIPKTPETGTPVRTNHKISNTNRCSIPAIQYSRCRIYNLPPLTKLGITFQEWTFLFTNKIIAYEWKIDHRKIG